MSIRRNRDMSVHTPSQSPAFGRLEVQPPRSHHCLVIATAGELSSLLLRMPARTASPTISAVAAESVQPRWPCPVL